MEVTNVTIITAVVSFATGSILAVTLLHLVKFIKRHSAKTSNKLVLLSESNDVESNTDGGKQMRATKEVHSAIPPKQPQPVISERLEEFSDPSKIPGKH